MIDRAGSMMNATVAIKTTNARIFVANREKDAAYQSRYAFFMSADWLREALALSNTRQAELARQLTASLERSIDRAAVNKMLSGQRAIQGDELLEIERITGLEAPKKIQVPLKGRVGAGQEVEAMDGGHETVDAPAQARPGTVAVEVSGQSMYPAYEAGTILYYSKLLPPAELVNRRAIVQLGDGRIFVKIVRRGSTENAWTLQSINSQFPDIVDQMVDWAAPIDWTKPR
jgi:phage repressor protein C with HTH and peptisase S24 domain